ncbi:hypothetical protein GDN83_09360 [Gordonia jinghuaiqii]|uniref:Uncharacterized protein n=1 Tax=Gordonia jinghuaiqii TaxID=2758710 RepID=A0A7D7RC54_9ACTN|nr:hypothetical protein [Gordonia jinghuaiqii]MCR5977937.1 hypothetical protein [Gordonia jinghuaiqii]QMT02590.1 hypothetical protein H1R19_05420 [Gordonia jinghuaiqii]
MPRLLTLCVALAAAGVVGFSSACAVESTERVDDRVASPHGAAVQVDYATASAVPPGFVSIERGRSTHPLRVSDGRMLHGNSTGPNAASYVATDLSPARVTRIGATVSFTGDDDASIALLVSAAPVPENESQPAPHAAVHFVARRAGWSYAIWEAGDASQTVLGQGTYQTAFDRDGARFEIELAGDRAKVYLPDATSIVFSDPRIAEFAGGWATWELYEASAGTAPASFRELWVS